MSNDNPFEVTSSGFASDDDRAATSSVEVAATTIDILNETRPWVLLVGILFWISVVFMALASAFMVVAGLATGQFAMVGMAALYVVFTIVTAMMASALTTFARKIQELSVTERLQALNEALAAQKKYWKILGIFIVVYLVFVVIAVIGAVLLPALMQF